MRRQNSPVPREGKSDSLRQAVHGVGCKHPRTTTATGTSTSLNLRHLLIAHRRIGSFDHSRNQIGILPVDFVCLHRPSGNKHRRDIQAHTGHQHTRRDLVAIRNANHGIRLMRVDHILHAVGDDVARGQRIQHPVVPHGDTVVDGYRIELRSITSHLFDFGFHHLPDFMQMSMPRHELGERIDDGHDRLPELFTFHPIGHPQCTGSRHTASFSALRTAQLMFHLYSVFILFLYSAANLAPFFILDKSLGYKSEIHINNSYQIEQY